MCSIASHSAKTGDEAKALSAYTLCLEYDPTCKQALDGISKLARQWDEADANAAMAGGGGGGAAATGGGSTAFRW